MKTIIISSLLLTTLCQADIIKCNFTEPFVSSEYSMAQSTLRYKPSEGKTTVIRNVSFQIKSEGVFELHDRNGKVLQTLTLNNAGSDGMSDRLYPYSVKDGLTVTHQGQGGCSSNYLK